MEPRGWLSLRRNTPVYNGRHHGQNNRWVCFKGMTSAYIGANTYLYVANFGKGRVDVYDNAFKRVHLGEDRFMDEEIPYDYAPFNVQTIGNDIVVSYAMKEAGATDETDGPGLGRIDLYSSSGRLCQPLDRAADDTDIDN